MTTTDPAPTASPEPKVGLRTTLTLGLFSAMGPLASDMPLPALPEITDSLHASEMASAATVTVCFAGFAIGQLLVGGLSDRLGRRRPLLVCIGLFLIAGIVCALAPTIEVLLLGRFLQGVFGAGGVVVARASVRDIAQGSGAAGLYSRLGMVTILAPIIAPLLGGQVLRFTSWRGLFWAFTIVVALVFVLALLLFKESLPPDQRRPSGGQIALMRRVLVHPGFGQHLVMSLCQGAVLLSYLTLSSLFLQNEYGVSAQAYSLLFALAAACMFGAHIVNIRVGPRWGALNMLTGSVSGYFTGALLLTIAVLAHAPLPLVVIAIMITLALYTPSGPNNMALAMMPFGAAAGTAAALLGATQQIAGAVIPTLGSRFGSPGTVMATIMLAGAAIGLVQIFTFVRPSVRRERAPFV
ncbi:Bcr/CflA family efflux MFS transporter [Nocardioides sp.]|uniref:Bcr/CflA family efflux MFS transporter n=1 Tax=Nocardioides sp. TaxID=35761 RepID=UPI002631EFF0|nr:Bcr/CflA family efflux MFS transporter [Nocardioides sp.]